MRQLVVMLSALSVLGTGCANFKCAFASNCTALIQDEVDKRVASTGGADPLKGLEQAQLPPKDRTQTLIGYSSQYPMYLDDDSFLAQPSLLLGKILLVHKRADGTCPALADLASNHQLYEFVDYIGWSEYTPATTPTTTSSVIVNQSLAASVDALSFLSFSGASKEVYSVSRVNQMSQRLDTSKAGYREARNNWLQNNNAYAKDSTACTLLVVEGFVHNVFQSKKFSEMKAGASGVYGVKVGGEAYSSNDQFESKNLFQLSFGALWRESTRGVSTGTPQPPARPVPFDERALQQDELRVVSGVAPAIKDRSSQREKTP
ncbi:hypothetical protein F0U61_26605 [Archangium violaceum]|uniref:hypothetical protein n=1 Tax=Archangium violaceum TaxID=83451 RepID=UPI002B2DF6A0|nr:hypothetical protein F0U61_26605 [Archangium violaceum]